MGIGSEVSTVPAVAEGNGERRRTRLFDSIFPDLFSGRKTDLQQQFTPNSTDIESLQSSLTFIDGYSRKNFETVSKQAEKDGETRKRQTANFVVDNFNEIGKLSATGGERISRSDLSLYGKLLKINETAPSGGIPNYEAWKKAHYDHELNQSFLPATGSMIGAVAGIEAGAVAALFPVLLRDAGYLRMGTGGLLVTAAVVASATMLASMSAGGSAGRS